MPTGPTSKLEEFDARDPLAALREEDPWAAFRRIEKIELRLELRYRHSLGKYSRFFLELERGKFVATRCTTCSKVWAPPRPVCPDDLSVTEWVELNGRGTLEGFSVIHRAPASVAEQVPYVLAYVRLDGADTLFPHLLRNCVIQQVQYGLRVKVVYANKPVVHPIQLMWFEPF